MIFDVVVVGAGHAGIEAAAAAARYGANVALISKSKEDIGQMSCNPAIGGLGKGHIVKEIDALDGLMPEIADNACIHFKILNKSKGAAVQGPRSQADRELYKNFAHNKVLNYKNITFVEGVVDDIKLKDGKVSSIELEDGKSIKCGAIVLTTGTFLSSTIFIGKERLQGGRWGEKSYSGLSKFLRSCNVDVARLKTGTPARLAKDSIDFSVLEEQKGDSIPTPFSYATDKVTVPQVSCYITHTNSETHNIIKENLAESPLFDDSIKGKGPRYCPSIEDKIHRFSQRDAHQIFLEPEGLNSNLIYPNGISTSLPKSVQDSFIRSIKGLENAKIVNYGYAIEYDYVNPKSLDKNLQLDGIKGLFLAGQINGTTGYEEAGGQGLIAGFNAARFASSDCSDFTMSRSDAYIAVMIDDLINFGVKEPYRMFTSRAEYRILLRADNADFRLTEAGYKAGFVSQKRYDAFLQRKERVEKIKHVLSQYSFTPNSLEKEGIRLNKDGVRRDGLKLLSLSAVSLEDAINIMPNLKEFDQKDLEFVENDCKYSSYIEIYNKERERLKKEESIVIPNSLDYSKIPSLSSEMVELYSREKPKNIYTASRMKGVTPASVFAVLAYVKKNNK